VKKPRKRLEFKEMEAITADQMAQIYRLMKVTDQLLEIERLQPRKRRKPDERRPPITRPR
jgi:hypothetical protein